MSAARDLGECLLAERDRTEDLDAAFAAIAHVEWYNQRLRWCNEHGKRPEVSDLTWPADRKGPTLASIAMAMEAEFMRLLWERFLEVERATSRLWRASKARGADVVLSEELKGRRIRALMTSDVLDAVPFDGTAIVDKEETAWEIYDLWRSLPLPRPPCPWSESVAKWLALPVPARLAQHDKLIMPRSVAHVEQDAPGYYLSRFQAAAHRTSSGQLMFGFEHEGERGPTLPANVWALGLEANKKKRGAVVGIPLRIWVACILHTPLNARHGSYPVEIGRQGDDPLTLRRFLKWLYYGARTPRPNEYWPRILDARDVVHDVEVIYADAAGIHWGRQVVRMDTPYTRPPLDHRWPVVTHFPPGDGTGPSISFVRLQYWSIRDAAAYRALINLAYRWHVEGKRLMPAKGKGKTHWLQRRDPKLYDRLIDADVDAICYPPGYGAKRRDQRIKDAYATLEKLVRAGDATFVDGRLLPPRPY